MAAKQVVAQVLAAGPEHCARLSVIAQAAKAAWGYPQAWLDAWRDQLTFTPEDLRTQQVFMARLDDEIVGLYALKCDASFEVTPPTASLEHLWVHPAAMGRGLGKQLFVHAVELARAQGVSHIEVLSDPYACGFYERQGAVHRSDHVGELFGEPRILPIYVYDIQDVPDIQGRSG